MRNIGLIYNSQILLLNYYSGGEICNIKHLHDFESVILAKLT